MSSVNSPFELILLYLVPCALCDCLLLSPLSSPPATFKCAFYQSNSWATAERSTDWAREKAPSSQLSCFIWLLLSRPVFPCEAAQLCVLMGLVKLLPCYPLSQHWTPSQSTARKNVWWKRKFVFWATNVFSPSSSFHSISISSVGKYGQKAPTIHLNIKN